MWWLRFTIPVAMIICLFWLTMVTWSVDYKERRDAAKLPIASHAPICDHGLQFHLSIAPDGTIYRNNRRWSTNEATLAYSNIAGIAYFPIVCLHINKSTPWPSIKPVLITLTNAGARHVAFETRRSLESGLSHMHTDIGAVNPVDESEPIVVILDDVGAIARGRQISKEQIRQILQEINAISRKIQIRFEVTDNAKYQDVIDALDACDAAGLMNRNLALEPANTQTTPAGHE